MKKFGFICFLFILVLTYTSRTISRPRSSATQTVTFAVNHSAKRALNIIANHSSISTSFFNSSETTTLQNSLKNMSAKVTIAETSTNAPVSKNTSDVHMDVKSILQTRNLASMDGIPTVVTITE